MTVLFTLSIRKFALRHLLEKDHYRVTKVPSTLDDHDMELKA